MTDLSIVIVNFNTQELILSCLNSVFKYPPKVSFKVVVVDNGSDDDSVKLIRSNFPQVKILSNNRNLGFAKGNNLGMKAVEADSYLLLNSDTEVVQGSLQKLSEFSNGSDFGIVSTKLVNSDGTFQPNVGELPTLLPTLFWLSGLDDLLGIRSVHTNDKKLYQDGMEIGWVSGSVMLIKSAVVKEVGLLDEKIFMYGEDIDYCWRAKAAGFKVGWTDQSEIVHIGGASSNSPQFNQWLGEFKGLIYLYKKNYGDLFALILEIFIELFVFLRVLAYLAKGKVGFAKNYVAVIQNI